MKKATTTKKSSVEKVFVLTITDAEDVKLEAFASRSAVIARVCKGIEDEELRGEARESLKQYNGWEDEENEVNYQFEELEVKRTVL